MRVIFHLHGELMMGDLGSAVVELAASWAIIMILTGLFLWWPRQASGLAGVLYPRLRAGSRIFWRDIHGVTGLWVSGFVLFMLLSGLPWAKQWGEDLKALRQLAAGAPVSQDWTTGRSSEIAQRAAMDSGGMAGMGMGEHAGHGPRAEAPPGDYAPLDTLVETVAPLHLAAPVLISPPHRRETHWTARSDAQNRTLRTNLVLDGRTGNVLSREDFDDRPMIDRAIAVGVAAHEGQLFGWPNQFLGLLTAIGVLCVAVSAAVMWWRRRPAGVLGAPDRMRGARVSLALATITVLLGILLPLFGLSVIAVLVAERLVLRRIPTVRDWLGLAPARA
jgi:uncharacterized iron-regulated membrane protein